jgi:uncharacterized membrane protein YgcG
MGLRSLSVLALIAFVVSACALVDPVDSRYDTVSRSLTKARNESIFLNLVRASHDDPLAFTTIANVTPTLTNTTSLALPSFTEGPGAILRTLTGAAIGTVNTFPTSAPGRDFVFGNTTASNATAVSTNFNVSTQETSAFYIGFLKPIDLQTLDYFIRQGYSRELLFWLFADAVQVKGGSGALGMRYDPPNDYGCDSHAGGVCLSDYISMAIAAGLTVEEQTQRLPSGGGSEGGGGGGGGDKSGSSGGGDKSSSSGASKTSSGSAKSESAIFARFCFDPVLGAKAQSQMGPTWDIIRNRFVVKVNQFGPKCGTYWDPLKENQGPIGDTLKFSLGPYTFSVVPRSAYGVFEFLGAVMKVQRDSLEPLPNVFIPGNRREEISQPPLLATVQDDPHLITVLRNQSTPLCFVHTWFEDGDYCVPDTATTTKRIFSLLAQLIAIQTAASDLSITPVVRIIQ